MIRKLILTTLIVVGFSGPVRAGTIQVTASGSGWINDGGQSNTTGFRATLNNHLSGHFFYRNYNNWFQFYVPDIAISSAILTIFNAGDNDSQDPLAAYNVHAASNFSFFGLVSGQSLGSVTAYSANNGPSPFVGISLNNLGVDFLNANRGSIIRFGGGVVSPCGTCDVTLFGFTFGNPPATLSLTEAILPTAVPEPAGWLMMIAGFSTIGLAVRRYPRRAPVRS